MGRKGVSKRKPKQAKSNSQTNGLGGGSVSSLINVAESQPARNNDSGKAASSVKGDARPSNDWKKKSKQG